MSAQASPATGKPYGVQRVCQVCQFPRSTLYAQQGRAASLEPPKAKRGPKPPCSDKELLALVRADLEQSPFSGEGRAHGVGGPAATTRWSPLGTA